MTLDPTPVPPAPTPRTRTQAATIHGANAMRDIEDEYLVFTLLAHLAPDDPALPVPPPTVLADIAALRSGIHPSYSWSAS